MKPSPGRFRLLGTAAGLATVFVIFIVAVIQLQNGYADSLPFGLPLVSRLSADYSGDPGGGRLGALTFRILEEALQDGGATREDARIQSERLRATLDGSVPTATARNYAGDPPFTATATLTPTSTPTPTPTYTPTPTNTPRPTNTPTKTNTPTPKPTNTPQPTATPTIADNQDPQIFPGASLNPPPGAMSGCMIDISNQRITDPVPSSGIAQVRLKYTDPNSGSFVFGSPLGLTSGGPTGGGWDGIYAGSIIFTGFSPPASTNLWIQADDTTGNNSSVLLGAYTSVDCP